MDLRGVIKDHNREIDSLVGGFKDELSAMVASAQAKALADLQSKLEIVDGKIARTPANQRILRTVDDIFDDAMERAGYSHLVEEFVNRFPGQLPYFQQTMDAISDSLSQPLKVSFSAADKAVLSSQQISAVEGLHSVVEGIAAAAKREALLSVGALKFTDLAQDLAKRFNLAVGEASSLAETSMVMFYRTISDRGYAQIEAGLPDGSVRYRFQGPDDKITRPFCHRILAKTKADPMTRAEIENLNNGQLPNPFITGGGFNCRHQWIICQLSS